LNLAKGNNAPRVVGEKSENLVAGSDRVSENKSSGLDVGALLDSIAQGQGNSQAQSPKPDIGDVGAEIANQVTGGGSLNTNQIIGGLSAQDQGAAKNQSTSQEQGNALGKSPQQGNAQNNGGNGRIIQIEQTIITEANGQQIQTEIIKDVGQPSAATAPAKIPPQATPAEARPTPPPAPMAEMPSEGKPAPPKVEPPVQAKNSTVIAESLKPMPTAQATQRPAERLNATVCIHRYSLVF
jgi:hypothetical protein